MDNPAVLFGSAVGYESHEVQSGAFTFRVATVSLAEPPRATSPTLSEFLTSVDSGIESDMPSNAIWTRARIERLFSVEQSQTALEIETDVDGQSYRDRLFLNFGFVGITRDHELQIAIPFTCTDFYGETHVATGNIPVRNGDRYDRLVASMMAAFWRLLHDDFIVVDDYSDTATIFGRSYRFGISSGQAFSDFPPMKLR